MTVKSLPPAALIKKVYLIDRQSNQQKEIAFNEFVDTLDMSGDGKYVVAGTGASPYFFEDIQGPNKDKVYGCETVIEPEPREQAQNKGIIMNNSQPVKSKIMKQYFLFF